jgi:prepilin-type N-terminal cleavage/methylation domain-containing protein
MEPLRGSSFMHLPSFRSRGRGAAAFTLIELMLVVTMIGILAAIALPSYSRFACRAKQTEAKTVLKQIYVAEHAYRSEFDTYLARDAADIHVIGVVVSGARSRYVFSVPDATADTYRAIAVGTRDMEDDLWESSSANNLENILNKCNVF